MRDPEGAPALFAGIMTPLGRQNKVDPLTQLLNRSQFVNDLNRMMKEDMVEQNGGNGAGCGQFPPD